MIDTSKSNYVHIIGTITSDIIFHHEYLCERFLETTVSVKRSSGVIDKINIIFPSRKLTDDIMIGDLVEVYGEIRSHNNHNNKSVSIFVYAQEILFNIRNNKDVNEIVFKGTLVSAPIFRTTPQGREVSNLTIAINRGYNKSSYIPCICWGNYARDSRSYKIGSEFICNGRLQSRDYTKGSITRTAYEVSLITIRHS